MNFDALPREMKIRIFSYLPQNDLFFNVVNVNKEWQVLSRDPHVLKHLEFDERYNIKQIIEFMTYYNLALSLQFTNFTDYNWLSEIPTHHCVEQLSFHESFVFDIRPLLQLPFKFPSLRGFKMTTCTSFQHTWYSNNYDLVFNFSTCCHQLEEFELGLNSIIEDKTFEILISQYGLALKKLRFSFFDISDDHYVMIKNCRQLTDLDLQDCYKMTDKGLLALRELTSLRQLTLYGAHFVTSNGFIALFKKIIFSHLQSITFLDLPLLSDDAVILMIASCPRLKIISLSCCSHVTNISAQAVITDCSFLESLTLRRNGNSLDVLKSFPRLPRLTYLQINQCAFQPEDEKDVLEFKKLNSQTQLITPFDEPPRTDLI